MSAAQHLSGTGDPNGSVFGSPGDTYQNLAGGAGTTLYLKESGVNTDVGWIAVASVPPFPINPVDIVFVTGTPNYALTAGFVTRVTGESDTGPPFNLVLPLASSVPNGTICGLRMGIIGTPYGNVANVVASGGDTIDISLGQVGGIDELVFASDGMTSWVTIAPWTRVTTTNGGTAGDGSFFNPLTLTIQHNGTLTGLGTIPNPLGVVDQTVGVAVNAFTLEGDGKGATPLNVIGPVTFDPSSGGGPGQGNIRGNRPIFQSPIDNTKSLIVNLGSQDGTIEPGATGAIGVGSTIGGGDDNTASGDYSTVPGGAGNFASGTYSYAEGWGSVAIGIASHAEGEFSEADGEASHSEGFAFANGVASHAENEGDAEGDSSHAEGSGTSNGTNSHAEGNNTQANGANSHAEGRNAHANGDNSHAEGRDTVAGAVGSHAEGISSTVTAGADYGHAEGFNTFLSAAAAYAHAEGRLTVVTGFAAHAEGDSTTASGIQSHAEGSGTTSSGDASHAEGISSVASGNYSHAEGGVCTASGIESHAEGDGCKATGDQSHAEGQDAIASRRTQWAKASGANSAYGDCQTSLLVMRGVTPGTGAAESVELKFGGHFSTIGTDQLVLEDGKAYAFKVIVSAGGVQAGPTRVSRSLELSFNARRDAGLTTITASIALVSYGDAAAATWTIGATVGAAPDRIVLTFDTGAGVASKCRVSAKVEFTEIAYPN